jgi:hypothetical protein
VSLPSDERRTPRWFFEACDRLWGPFDVDCFAARWNHQCPKYFTRERSFYEHGGTLRMRRGWVQPPYSRGQLDKALGFVRELVLCSGLERAACLVPVDPSTDWWKTHVARPEGRKLTVRWLTGELPPPFHLEAYQLVSAELAVTVALPDVRLAFDPPPDMPPRDAVKFRGAKQPSVVVVFERAVQTSAGRNCNPVATTSDLIVRSAR